MGLKGNCSPNGLAGSRAAKVVLATAVLGGLALGATSAVGATAPAGGSFQVWGTPANNGGGPVLFTGAIADSGKSESANASGSPSKNGQYKLLVLKKGNILINTVQLNNELNSNTPPTAFDKTTCSGSFVVTAPVPIVKGTKAYVGATGSANVTVTFAFILPLTKGKCNTNTNANPTAQWGSIAGTGTVSFG